MLCFGRTRGLVEVVSLFELYSTAEAKCYIQYGLRAYPTGLDLRFHPSRTLASEIQDDAKISNRAQGGGPIRKMADDLCGTVLVILRQTLLLAWNGASRRPATERTVEFGAGSKPFGASIARNCKGLRGLR